MRLISWRKQPTKDKNASVYDLKFIVFYLLRIPLEIYAEDAYHFNWAIKRCIL